jgi:hypothetical protein
VHNVYACVPFEVVWGGSLSLSRNFYVREKKTDPLQANCVFSLFFPPLVYVCKRMTLRNELQTCVCVCAKVAFDEKNVNEKTVIVSRIFELIRPRLFSPE